MLGERLLQGLSKDSDLAALMLAEEAGSGLLMTVEKEFNDTLMNFETVLAGTYLTTRAEYKKLRKKFLGGTIASETDHDSVEDDLMMSFFGMKPPKPQNVNGPAVPLIDDNCVLTQLLIDIAANLPRYYEKTTPILKRGKLTGKTTTTKMLDTGEVEDWAGTMMALSNDTYMRYILCPNDLTKTILDVIQSFQYDYVQIADPLEKLVIKANLTYDTTKRRTIHDPNALVKQYNRINFLSIRPSAEDIAPRTKLDQDLSVARTKLFIHLKTTIDELTNMDRYDQATEDFAVAKTKEAIDLKKALDDIQKTEAQKNLARNIADDNEFYCGKGGQHGSLEIEREPAPKIQYTDVVGSSFGTAKEHIEEVVKVASHPHIMRLTAPRGDVKSNVMLIGPYGCHRRGQEVLMYDGTTKKVEDIVVGDLLMGPDSTPREVLRLVRGVDDMVEILPKKGDPWVVNQYHTMKLVKTQDRSKKVYRAINELVEVPLNEYLKWPQYKKTIHPLYRVPIDFQETSENPNLSIEPYMLGVLLGDGCLRNRQSVSTADPDIVQEIYAYAASVGLSVNTQSKPGNLATDYNITTGMIGGQDNPLRTKLREMNLFDCDSSDKFIPHAYKTSCRENRRKILAGLMDTDGHLHGTTCYDLISKSKRLTNDIAFVARSLGLAAYVSPCKKKSQNGTEGQYFRVIVSGDVNQIPVKLPHKKASKRIRKNNVLRTGFSTRKLGKEKFYGFTVSNDNLYLLNDFTVIRNCGKSEMAKAIGADKRIIGFNVSTADLLTAFMHESVKNVKRMFDHAKDLRRNSRYTKPVGILMDEFDRLFNYGEGVHAAYDGARMTGVLQEMMDGIVGYEGVFLVALTNVPKAVPEAVLRRFKFVDVVGQLTQEERAFLFKMFLTKGLPVDPAVVHEDYMKWAEMLDNAPGDVIGKVTDEIHFKFMHELAINESEKIGAIEKALSKRLRDRETKKQDYEYVKKALGTHKIISAADITSALESTISQPQVKMQIAKARQVYRDANDIMKGLSAVGASGLGFGAEKKSVVWSD